MVNTISSNNSDTHISESHAWRENAQLRSRRNVRKNVDKNLNNALGKNALGKRLGWKRRHGVSEVVANILILAITTTMFAGIIVWAMTFPHPITSKRTEFDTQLTLLPGDKGDLKITLKSGEALKASEVRIIIAVDNYIVTKSLSDSPTWSGGLTWTPSTSVNYTLNNVKFDSTVSVVILVDDGHSSVIAYKTTVLKGNKNQAPIIIKLYSTPYPILTGNKFSLHAFVWDPDGNLDSNRVFVNLSSFNAYLSMPFNSISLYKMEKVADNHYSTIELSIVQDAPLGIMPVSVNATDSLGLETVFNTTVTIGQEVQEVTEVDLMIKNTDVTVDNMYPLQGEKITIYARMTNIGGRGAESTIVFWDGYNELGRGEVYGGGNTIYIQGNYDTREFYYEWIPTSPGTHTIRAEARVVSSDPLDVDVDITNNFASINITVFPKILLVDDDNHASDKTREDTVGFMEAALNTLGFKYEVYRVKSGANGPAYSVGDHNLSGYGIVIWMCGYQTSSTLTSTDIANLKQYLDASTRSLWLIGAGILDDLSPTDGNTPPGSFLESYLQVKSVQHNVGIPNPIVGVPTHWMTAGYQFVTTTVGCPNTADSIVPDTDAEGMFYNASSGQNLSLTHVFPNTGSKLCFQSYPISQLRNLNDIATVAYKVIKWLGGNITIASGQDVAVSQQEIDNTHPYYMDTIQISGVVRNNRDTSISNVRVRVMLDNATKLNETIIPLLDVGASQNSYAWVYANWTADSLGLHRIYIIADPLDEIIETDETNNIAPLDFSITEVFVMYDILIVDDDNSENNGGTAPNETEYITNAFDNLGYNYSYFLVNQTTEWNGPGNETILSYNLVIWCTGTETTNTLTEKDRLVVARYLNSHGYFWLIGSGFINDLRTNDINFLRDVLHVASQTVDLEIQKELRGNDNDFTLYGKRFLTEQPTGYEGNIVDSIVPDAQSVGLIYDENNLRCFALKYDNPDPANNAKLMLFTFDLAHIMNKTFPRELSLVSSQTIGNEREELIYLCARWFGVPDSRIELKIETIDFSYSVPPKIMNRNIEQLIPIVGDTYILHARVFNVGTSRGDCVVRFVDGDTIINSATISVGANSSSIAEVIWRPLYAGTRTISVIVDPNMNIKTSTVPSDYTKEIFKHNNVINHTFIVYYFYDDMELGPDNWEHDTTLVNINGESPLEFIDTYGNVSTNIVSKINSTQSSGFSLSNSIYHSYNTSYVATKPIDAGYRYEFFMSYHNAVNTQGFYVVGVAKNSNFTVFNMTDQGEWIPQLMDVRINKSEIKHYHTGDYPWLVAHRLYKIESSGPLLIVVTSKEGSNVNVANYDDGKEIGRNFVTIGKKVVVVCLQPSTRIEVRSYTNVAQWSNFVNNGGSDPGTLVADEAGVNSPFTTGATETEGYYRLFTPDVDDEAPIAVHTDKDVIVFRISGDNDELDTGISSLGSSTGSTIYFPYAGTAHDPCMLVYNTGPNPCTITLTDISQLTYQGSGVEYNIASATSKVIPGKFADTFYWSLTDSYAKYPNICHLYRVNIVAGDTTGIKIVYGGDSNKGSITTMSDFDVTYTDTTADDTYEFFGFETVSGKYQVTAPLVLCNDGTADFSRRVQIVTVAGMSEIDVSPPIALLDSKTGNNTNVIRYMSVMDVTLTYSVAGTGNPGTISITGAPGAHTDDANKLIYLPRGNYTVTITASGGSGTWYVGISKMFFSNDGSFAWTTKYIRAYDGIDYSKGKFAGTPKYWWNFTSDKRFIWLVSGDGNCWIHTILPYEGAIVMNAPLAKGDGTSTSENSRAGYVGIDWSLTTETFNLSGFESAKLTFFQKTMILPGGNGGVVMVGTDPQGKDNWKWKYVMPLTPYTNNLKWDVSGTRIQDSYGTEMRWCFGGISGAGLFTWEYITVDLTPFVGISKLRIMFRFLNISNCPLAEKWIIDDIKVTATRANSQPTIMCRDQWEYITGSVASGTTHSGIHAWWCHNTSVASTSDTFMPGIDNSLYTRQIDLTNARNATFEAYFKFNINNSVGRPPDSLRVEVSNDNGKSWRTLTLGVRAAWNVSGTETAGPDGKSYTGVNEGNNWVSSNTLSRLTTDLTGWAGSVIKLRIRVVSATDHANYQSNTGPFGVYVDDVKVYGTSLEGGRSESSQEGTRETSDNLISENMNENMNGLANERTINETTIYEATINVENAEQQEKSVHTNLEESDNKGEVQDKELENENIDYLLRINGAFVGRDEL